MLRLLIGFLLSAGLSSQVFATQANNSQENFKKLKPSWLITELPNSAWDSLKFAFQRDSVPLWVAIINSSALLYQYDDEIYAGAKDLGRRWGLGNHDATRTVFKVGKYPILRLPSDTGSALYFLGDGWTHFAASLGFVAYGHLNDAPKAWNTGLQIFHGMIVSTVFNQALKRSTGRESPNQVETDPRGAWRPFPSVEAYNKQTAKYDAVPSGHVMTTTLVFTTIRLNYPEYDYVLLPLQAVWSTALMFQMVNNGVHWASDYPLGIAMGWAVAKVVVRNGTAQAKVAASSSDKWYQNWAMTPITNRFGDTMVGAYKDF
jgi:hypothetical protein